MGEQRVLRQSPKHSVYIVFVRIFLAVEMLLACGDTMKKIGVILVLVSLFILIILPKIIFPESDTVDSTGIVNAIRFTGIALIFSGIGIKLFFQDK